MKMFNDEWWNALMWCFMVVMILVILGVMIFLVLGVTGVIDISTTRTITIEIPTTTIEIPR